MVVSLDCRNARQLKAAEGKIWRRKPVLREGIMGNHHESNRKWKSVSNSFRCRYVGKRPCRYPQDTAESFVKWSSAGLLHSPAFGTVVVVVVRVNPWPRG